MPSTLQDRSFSFMSAITTQHIRFPSQVGQLSVSVLRQSFSCEDRNIHLSSFISAHIVFAIGKRLCSLCASFGHLLLSILSCAQQNKCEQQKRQKQTKQHNMWSYDIPSMLHCFTIIIINHESHYLTLSTMWMVDKC